MVRFDKGPELDMWQTTSRGSSFTPTVELDGHCRGFKVVVTFGVFSGGNEGLSIRLTPYTGEHFDLRIGIPNSERGHGILEDIVEDGSVATKDKLAKVVTFALSYLSDQELLKMFSLMYKAGKHSGKNEIRKRFNQLMKEA